MWEIINQNRDADEIIVPRFEIPSWSETIIGNRTFNRYALDGYITPYYESYLNILFAQYYGLKKIRVEE